MTKTFAQSGFGREYPWIDLVNSWELEGSGQPTDHLKNPAWVTDFLHHWQFAASAPQPVPLKQLVKLRRVLRRIAESLNGKGRIRAADLQDLNAEMKVLSASQLVQHQNGWSVTEVPARAGWPWILAKIAKSVITTLQEGKIEHLKICPDAGCLWLFYDRTKGNTRRWCNDRTCGNRDRVRRARKRAAAGAD